MSEQYTRIYISKSKLYAQGAPVIVKAGALLRDNGTGNILGQVKFENVSQKKIIALKIELTAYDMADRQLGEAIEHQYLDLSANSYTEFGSKEAILLPDNSARSFRLKVTEAVFEDKSIWSGNEPFETVREQNTLVSVLREPELVRQYQIKTNSGSSFEPADYKDLYLCACGSAYKKAIDRCPFCGKAFSDLVEALDLDVLKQEKIVREEAQKEAEEKRHAEEQASEERRRVQKKKGIKLTVAAVSVVVVVIAAVLIVNNIVVPEMKYKKGEKLLASEDYDEAIVVFEELGDYKAAKGHIQEAKEQIKEQALAKKYEQAENLSANGDYDKAIEVFKELEEYKDAKERILETAYKKGENLYAEGKTAEAAMAFGKAGDYADAKERSFALWDTIAKRDTIAFGILHSVGLKTDGTVIAVGNSDEGRCDVAGWTDIVAVAASWNYTMGLKSDGTVIVAGNIIDKAIGYDWNNIVAISVTTNILNTAIGLKSDGTVVVAGSNNENGECNVEDWTDIVAIAASSSHTVGLRADGTVVAVGDNKSGQCDVEGWTDIKAIAAGDGYTVGVKTDGTVVATAWRGELDSWTDIADIAIGYSHIIGLKTDGTVVAAGSNDRGQCEVGSWTNIVAIAAGFTNTIGLKADGTMVSVGEGGTNGVVSGMSNIKVPQ